MKKRTIYVTENDMRRLINLIGSMKSFSQRDSDNIRKLKQALEIANMVKPSEIPGDVVTMNSRVTIRDMESNEQMVYTLVYPEKADFREGRISIFAPIGSAILGYKVGDVVEWEVPKGTKKIRIEEIHYQPEASGDF